MLEVAQKEKKAPAEVLLKKEILEKFPDFMQSVGLTDTGDHWSIAICGRRVLAYYASAVSEHIGELLKENFNKELSSDWQFPIVALEKKNGFLQITIVLRQLKAITVKNQFLMSRVN